MVESSENSPSCLFNAISLADILLPVSLNQTLNCHSLMFTHTKEVFNQNVQTFYMLPLCNQFGSFF